MKNLLYISRPVTDKGEGTGIAVISFWLYKSLKAAEYFNIYTIKKIPFVPLYHSPVAILFYDILGPIFAALRLYLYRIHIDELVFIEPSQAITVSLLKRILKPTRITVIFHDAFFLTNNKKNTLYEKYLAYVFRQAVSHSNSLIATTNENATLIERHYTEHPSIFTIPFGLTLHDNGEPPFFETQDIVVGYLGSSGPRKRIDRLLAVAKMNYANGIKSTFLLAGPISPSYITAFKVIADSSNAVIKLKYLGQISEYDKVRFYKTIDMFIYPTKEEGFGLPILESTYFAKPCIIFADALVPQVMLDYALIDVGNLYRIRDLELDIGKEKKILRYQNQKSHDRKEELISKFGWHAYVHYFKN